ECARGVTASVGPNGSGKSNIIDARRWATGGGRATAFRAEEKTELIFHGASGKRSVSLAEVEVELVGPRGTVKVWRSLDRDGNTRLRLNGRAARFLEIGRASCRERVEISVVAGWLEEKREIYYNDEQ